MKKIIAFTIPVVALLYGVILLKDETPTKTENVKMENNKNLIVDSKNIKFPITGSDEVLMFDNTSPGKWLIKTIDYLGLEKTVITDESGVVCITEKDIENNLKRNLKEKLSLNDTSCSTTATRTSEKDANFILSCSGFTPEQLSYGSKIEGVLHTDKDKSYLKLDYTVAKANEDLMTIKKEIYSERIGDCN